MKHVAKIGSGVPGLDVVTHGGLPSGRATLVSGGPGAGKTLLGLQFLVGGVEKGEPGLLVSFEVPAEKLRHDFGSLELPVERRLDAGLLSLKHIALPAAEPHQAGSFTLDGLFLQLERAIDEIGARRVVLDTIDILLGSFRDRATVRREINRLVRWLEQRGITAMVTQERLGDGDPGHDLEEFVFDCVVFLDHRVEKEVSTRRLRVLKYRGSPHGTNEYPFLIGEDGIQVLPITKLTLDHPAPTERVSSGIEGLDELLEGKGYYRGSTIQVSGSAGTGKSTLAASLAEAACARGERCLYFAFEESKDCVIRNMGSVGISLEKWIDSGKLSFNAVRPTVWGLEQHLARMEKLVDEVEPDIVIIDPITNLVAAGELAQVRALLMRFIAHLRAKEITCFMTYLVTRGRSRHHEDVAVSSEMDTLIALDHEPVDGGRKTLLRVVKSRGMAHSTGSFELTMDSGGAHVEPA